MAQIEQVESTISADGTRIAFSRTGDGPPLLLVHGTGADRSRWKPLLPELEETFTVLCMDRRGRGDSGDGPAYALEREYEDIAAVVDTIGEPVNLLAHSFGALSALEGALLTDGVRKLLLYEGIPIPGLELWRAETLQRIQELVDGGWREEALILFMQEAVHLPTEEIEMLQRQPSWQGRVAAVHTIPRELRAFSHYAFDEQRFHNLAVPTAFLVGENNPPAGRTVAERAAAAMPNAQVIILPGQGHTAMNTAPELFVETVEQFVQV
jgi:pimeloyl-ACP methyl ester carboxylesterase